MEEAEELLTHHTRTPQHSARHLRRGRSGRRRRDRERRRGGHHRRLEEEEETREAVGGRMKGVQWDGFSWVEEVVVVARLSLVAPPSRQHTVVWWWSGSGWNGGCNADCGDGVGVGSGEWGLGTGECPEIVGTVQ